MAPTQNITEEIKVIKEALGVILGKFNVLEEGITEAEAIKVSTKIQGRVQQILGLDLMLFEISFNMLQALKQSQKESK